jgi:hypothetical protein
MEHASIASFHWFALELLHVGAPPRFIEAAQQAASDELQHAQRCFALASRFAGQSLGPTSLAIDHLSPRSLPELAVAVLLEGCIGETLAAALARDQLERCGDEQSRDVLSVIARDEEEHSLLAWRFLRYAVERCGPQVIARLQAALADASRATAPVATSVPPQVWNHYGRLTPDQEHEVIERTWNEVILPAFTLLCASEPAHATIAQA